jgi:hypothetical protein
MSLETRLRRIITLMYDTGVSLDQLEAEVVPFFAEDIAFVDPAVSARGLSKVRTGMRGFHCAFKFELDIHQMTVDAERGRALVDATMNLRSIPGYCYPLRTTLVYDFEVDASGEPRITRIEEMWALGDLVANAPLGIGALYDRVFRPASGVLFLGFFWLTTVLRRGRVRPSRPLAGESASLG